MNKEEMNLILLRGTIAGYSEEEQALINEAKEKVDKFFEENFSEGDAEGAGYMAISLKALEFAVS